MKIIKLLGFVSILTLITIPFVLLNKHEIDRFIYVQGAYCPTPVDGDIKEIKDKINKLENKVDILEKKIDKAQLCKVKKDVDELKKITYGLMGVIGGSGVLVSGTNLIKKKK